MTQSAAVEAAPHVKSRSRGGVAMPLNAVTSPGTYVCHWSGHLLRVPPRGLGRDGALGVDIVGSEPLVVTKISDDPDLPLSKARGLAWSFGLTIGF